MGTSGGLQKKSTRDCMAISTGCRIMLRFQNPLSIVGAGVSAGLSLIGGTSQAKEAERSSAADVAFAELQAKQDAEQARRDVRDETEVYRIESSRTRAVLAAQGVDLTDNTAVSILSAIRRESDIRISRIQADTKVAQEGYRLKSQNIRAAGRARARNSLLTGFGGAISGVISALSMEEG